MKLIVSTVIILAAIVPQTVRAHPLEWDDGSENLVPRIEAEKTFNTLRSAYPELDPKTLSVGKSNGSEWFLENYRTKTFSQPEVRTYLMTFLLNTDPRSEQSGWLCCGAGRPEDVCSQKVKLSVLDSKEKVIATSDESESENMGYTPCDAIRLRREFDPTIYWLSKDVHAFGIRAGWCTQSTHDGGCGTNLLLYTLINDKLLKVLDVPAESDGCDSGVCESSSSTFIVADTYSKGYRDILVRTKNSKRKEFIKTLYRYDGALYQKKTK